MELFRFATGVCMAGFLLWPAALLAVEGDETSFNGAVAAGYRAVSSDGNPDRAAEYRFLDSSPNFGLDLRASTGHKHFVFDGKFENENDYQAEAHLDHGGLARLNLRTERFFHNLDHIPYDQSVPESRPDGVTSAGGTRVTYEDFNTGEDYGLRIDTNEAVFRGKLKAFPAHLNLSYWRFEKKGDRQLRFVDEGHDNGNIADGTCNSCHMQSKTRDIDRITEEVAGGFDTHLGAVNLQFEQVLRQFRDREPIPVDRFKGHWLRVPGGDFQHDESPDSKLTESTLRLYTSQAGGFIASAGLTVGERENRSDLVDVRPVDVETDYYKASGDLTVIPDPRLTLNFRYRLLDMDSSNDNTLASDSLVIDSPFDVLPPLDHSPVDVRDAIDIRRAYYSAAANYRPTRHLTLKGEYKREEIHRGNTGGPDEHHSFITNGPINIDPVWNLPQDEEIDRFRVGFHARMLKKSALKFNGWYQYSTSDDPAYGASAEESHQAFLSVNLAPSASWGVFASANVLKEKNNQFNITQFGADGDGDGEADEVDFELDRDHERENLSLGIWSNPGERTFCSLNYGYLRTRTVQDLLFGSDPASGDTIPDENVEFSQRVQTLSAQASYRLLENLKCRLEGYHIRSFGKYSPDFAAKVADADSFPADPAGLKDISRLAIRQNGLRAGIDLKIEEAWNISADYTYDDYEERYSSAFDGTVQTYMVTLARAW